MAGSLADIKTENKLIEKIATMERDLAEMRSNQVRKIAFGSILIDGTGSQGVITIGTGITITTNSSGQGQILINDGTTNRIIIGFE